MVFVAVSEVRREMNLPLVMEPTDGTSEEESEVTMLGKDDRVRVKFKTKRRTTNFRAYLTSR